MKERFIFVTLLIIFSMMTHPARRRTGLIPSRGGIIMRRRRQQAKPEPVGP